MNEIKNVVGLFGVCGTSTWRKSAINKLTEEGVEFFNPQVDNWTPELAAVEAAHLVTDRVILMVINEETTGFGSLAEVGFSLRSAERNGQTLVLVMQDFPGDPKSDANRTRKLVRAHAKQAGLTVYVTVEEGVAAAIQALRA